MAGDVKRVDIMKQITPRSTGVVPGSRHAKVHGDENHRNACVMVPNHKTIKPNTAKSILSRAREIGLIVVTLMALAVGMFSIAALMSM